ncbi:tyrosine-protein phosphatase [Sporichthya brevicatena]|uniref:Tyrosine-protein phosphatase n=1 Tax=Sporichthya brevicatena TaxID=171442 RepID=A0ABP3RI28_9ACTN
MSADTRFLAAEGLHNLRDVGGYPTAGGGRIRAGLLLRGGALGELTTAAHPMLLELGLRTVIDLREDKELVGLPDSVLPDGLALHRNPLYRGRIRLGEIDDLAELYTQILERCADQVVAAIEVLAGEGALPALVHCSAGKDRTGLIVGVLLSALGVPDDVVAVDYARSEEAYVGELRERTMRKGIALGAREDRMEELMSCPPELMHAVLADLRTAHGSAEGYLVAGGLRAESLAALRERMVERAS